MNLDIARLSIAIDSTGAKNGASDLDKLTATRGDAGGQGMRKFALRSFLQ
jgi:hypothetical protein